MIETIIGIAIGAAAYELVHRAWSAAPTLRGWVRVSELRAVFAGCFFFFATLAVSLSYTGHHREATYVVWYALAGVSLIGVVVTTTFIGVGRSAAPGPPLVAAPAPQPELVSPEHRDQRDHPG